jgi:hypothetical protein
MNESDYLKRPDARGFLAVKDALRRWDPIGVYEIDPNWPDDEYDGYISEIIRILDAGGNVQQVSALLLHFASDNMAVNADHEQTLHIAAELVELWKELRTT